MQGRRPTRGRRRGEEAGAEGGRRHEEAGAEGGGRHGVDGEGRSPVQREDADSGRRTARGGGRHREEDGAGRRPVQREAAAASSMSGAAAAGLTANPRGGEGARES